MRNSCRSWFIVGAVAVATAFAGNALHAAEEDEDEDDSAATQKIAREHLDKSVARGKELWSSKSLGKKTCAQCHEDPEKPLLDLKTRQFAYPAYSTKKKTVVTMGQKINEMLSGRSRGKEMDLTSADLIALEAYVVSMKKK